MICDMVYGIYMGGIGGAQDKSKRGVDTTLGSFITINDLILSATESSSLTSSSILLVITAHHHPSLLAHHHHQVYHHYHDH